MQYVQVVFSHTCTRAHTTHTQTLLHALGVRLSPLRPAWVLTSARLLDSCGEDRPAAPPIPPPPPPSHRHTHTCRLWDGTRDWDVKRLGSSVPPSPLCFFFFFCVCVFCFVSHIFLPRLETSKPSTGIQTRYVSVYSPLSCTHTRTHRNDMMSKSEQGPICSLCSPLTSRYLYTGKRHSLSPMYKIKWEQKSKSGFLIQSLCRVAALRLRPQRGELYPQFKFCSLFSHIRIKDSHHFLC